MSPSNPRTRHQVLGIVALALFTALFTRLWYLQVLTTNDYELAAQSNRTREVITQAPRGRILDRNGNEMVTNRRTIRVTLSYQDFTALDEVAQGKVMRRLAQELTTDQDRQWRGEVVANDPGMLPVAAPTGDARDEAPPVTVAPGTVAPEVTTTSTTLPEQRPPPAGVATGSDNPDGQGLVPSARPEPVTEEILRQRLEDPRYSKFKPVPVATDVSEDLEIYLWENAEQFPAVAVERVTVRDYRYGALLAHVLGSVGAIDADELEVMTGEREKPYANDDEIGKTGIEASMEHELRGTPGRVIYEVDARNRPVRELTQRRREAQPGNDVYLTIDINLQYLAEMGLAAEVERRRGVRDRGCFVTTCDIPGAAAVAIDPRDGGVLAMASYPTFDPQLFVGGISDRDYEAVADPERAEEHHSPLLNRAISGQYPPGSTFKLFSAYAGLATDQITPEYVYDDPGVYNFTAGCNGRRLCSKRNAGGASTGLVNLPLALTKSSDTYFYKLGDESWERRGLIGETAMQDQLQRWGLGEPTGVDLTNEAPGRIPTPKWLRAFSEEINADDPEQAEQAGRWTGATSASTMVGQGDVLLTPLQLANGYATLANGGTIWLPQLVRWVTPLASDTVLDGLTPESTGQVPMPPEWRDPLIAGFDGVTKADGGTATAGFTGFDQSTCPVAGKTGTAQALGKNDSSLFTAFAPTPTPTRPSTIAVAAIFEQGGFGSSAAVPLVRRMLEPIAQSGCDLAGLNAVDSPFKAPVGGWFDVEAVADELGATETTSSD